MNRTEYFPESVCRKAMNFAIVSACFGAVSQIVFRESSIIILYASKMGAGRFLALFSTSIQLLCICVFIVPVSYIMEHTGIKKLVLPAIVMTLVGVLIVAAAGFFSKGAQALLVTGLLIFAVSLAVYVAGWFPLLKGVVPDRFTSRFFGRLRMSWQAVVTLFLVCSLFFIGNNASVRTLQVVIGATGFLILGRLLLVMKIPEAPLLENVPGFLQSLKELLRSRRLIQFGVFIFLFSLFSDSSIPVAYLFAKQDLLVSDNFSVLLSVFVNIGSIAGFALGGIIFHKIGTQAVLFLSGFIIAALNAALLFVRDFNPVSSLLFIVIITLYAMILAAVFVGISAKMLSLAAGRIVNISLAAGYAFQTAGKGLSRIGSGFLLDSGILPESWYFGGTGFSDYHGFFVFMACSMLVVLASSLLAAKLGKS